jgi:hypothetical protein
MKVDRVVGLEMRSTEIDGEAEATSENNAVISFEPVERAGNARAPWVRCLG